jgi:hypothetical protein
MTVPYTLGVFTGNPGDSNAVAQFNNFKSTVGATPTIINLYVDGTVNPDTWEGSVGYWMGEWKANAPWNEPGVIPMWGMPMGSTNGTYTPQQVLQRYIAGDYDGYLQAVVNQTKAAGYSAVYCRPGVEMNLSSTPGYSGYEGDPGLWVQAFQHIYTTLHAAAEAAGNFPIKVIWNPGVTASQSVGNAMAVLWPGVKYADAVGLDNYADLWPWGPLTDAEILSSTANMEQYYSYPAWNGTVNDASNGQCVSLLTTIAFAKAQGLPLAICETGAGATGNGGPADNPVWWEWLRKTLDGAVADGVTVEFVSFWNANGGGTYQFTGGQQPNACAAITANFGVNAPPIPSTPPAHEASPAGTQVNGTSGTIYDTQGNAWTISSSQQIERNGMAVASSSGVVTLFWTGTTLDQLNTKGDWWTQPLDGSAGVATTAPAGYKPPTPPHAASPAGTTLPAPTTIYDTAGNAWTLPTVGGQIFLNGKAVSSSANVEVLWWTGTALLQLNEAGQWWTQPLDGSAGVATTAPAGYTG